MKSTKAKKRAPLKITLAAAFLAFSAVLLTVLWIVQTVFLDDFYKTIKTNQVKSCAKSVCENIEDDDLGELISDIEDQNAMAVSIFSVNEGALKTLYRTGDGVYFQSDFEKSKIYDYFDKAKAENGEYAEIIARVMQRRFDRVDENMNPNNFAPTEDNEEADNDEADTDSDEQTAPTADDNAGGQFGAFFGRTPPLERETVSTLAFVKLESKETNDYLVILESEITPVTSVVETLRIQLVILTVVLAAISVAVAFFVARGISKPLSATNEESKKLAKQDYDVHFKNGTYREINELNETLSYAATELRKVDGLRKELIANISHDLRTPLTMITGYAEVMRDLPGEVTSENIQIIIDEASRLNSLVSDLLDISRLESGNAEIKKAPFSLTRCVENIFSRYTKLIEAEGYDIRFEKDREVFVNGDELRITQVLYNLMNNAIHYIGEDKTVIVRQTVAERKVKIEVIDHGEGIDEDQIAYIWDRYYRVDKEHKQAKIGSGLGLSIVKNILEAHDAAFGVESRRGEGATFWFEMERIDTE